MPTQPGYLDFEINIDRDGADYVVRVSSLGGRAESRFGPPFTPHQRADIRQALTNAALHATATRRRGGSEEARQMKDFGELLFNHIFTAEVKDYYYQCRGQAMQQGQGLRLRLTIDPSLNDLPWEFLSTGKEFIALNPQTPIVRFIEHPHPTPPLQTELPLCVLVVIANPGDQIALNTEAEKKRIDSALKQLQDQNLVQVTYLEGPDTWPRLIDLLRFDTIHILHFIGHGAFDAQRGEGVLLMEDPFGDALYVGSEQLKVLMLGKRHLRLVLLNSCVGTAAQESEPFSSVGAGLVRAGVPAVIAMQFEVSDRAARLLAETFYESLALNLPVDRALTEARREIALTERDSLEWATPVLFMQVADGQLFDVNGPTATVLDTDAIVAAKYSQKADAAFDRKEWDRALNYYLFMVAQDPTNEKAKNRVDMIQRLKKQKTTDAYMREKLTLRADEAFDAQNWEQAYNLYKLLVDIDSKNERAKRRLAMIEKLRTKHLPSLPAVEPATPVAAAAWVADPGQRICPHCGHLLARTTTAHFCPHCSKPLTPLPTPTAHTKAAEHYQAGDRAFLRGQWADAVAGYRAALSLIPNYRDATQKAAQCDLINARAQLFEQAQKLGEAGDYIQALSVLGQLRNSDPHWPGLADLQALCECGQQYQLAISQLKVGKRERGAELLRQVVAKRPGFLDAAWRLEELQNGGDGLLSDATAKTSKK